MSSDDRGQANGNRSPNVNGPMEQKFCYQCGRAIDKTAGICPHCGRAQPSVQGAPAEEPKSWSEPLESGNPYQPVEARGQGNASVFAATPEEKNWAMACHLASFLGSILPVVGSFIGPLAIWLTQREKFPLVDDQGKESLNFQITILIFGLVTGVLVCAGIGIIFIPVLAVYDVVMVIIASVKASQGIAYRYPMTIRLIT